MGFQHQKFTFWDIGNFKAFVSLEKWVFRVQQKKYSPKFQLKFWNLFFLGQMKEEKNPNYFCRIFSLDEKFPQKSCEIDFIKYLKINLFIKSTDQFGFVK